MWHQSIEGQPSGVGWWELLDVMEVMAVRGGKKHRIEASVVCAWVWVCVFVCVGWQVYCGGRVWMVAR